MLNALKRHLIRGCARVSHSLLSLFLALLAIFFISLVIASRSSCVSAKTQKKSYLKRSGTTSPEQINAACKTQVQHWWRACKIEKKKGKCILLHVTKENVEVKGHLTLIWRGSREGNRVKLFDFRHIFIYFVDAVPDVLNLQHKRAHLS